MNENISKNNIINDILSYQFKDSQHEIRNKTLTNANHNQHQKNIKKKNKNSDKLSLQTVKENQKQDSVPIKEKKNKQKNEISPFMKQNKQAEFQNLGIDLNVKKMLLSEGPNNSFKYKRSMPVQREAEISQRNDNKNRKFSHNTNTQAQNDINIEKAFEIRKQAYKLYQNGEFYEALEELGEAFSLFKNVKLSKRLKIENQIMYNLIKDCNLFVSSCYIKINQFYQAISQLQQLFELEPNNVKVLYLRGKAYMNLKEFEVSLTNFNKAQSLEPDNQILNSYIKQIQNVIQNDQELKLSVQNSEDFKCIDSQNQPNSNNTQISTNYSNFQKTDSYNQISTKLIENTVNNSSLIQKRAYSYQSLTQLEQSKNQNQQIAKQIQSSHKTSNQDADTEQIKNDLKNKISILQILKQYIYIKKPQIVQAVLTILVFFIIILLKQIIRKATPSIYNLLINIFQ